MDLRSLWRAGYNSGGRLVKLCLSFSSTGTDLIEHHDVSPICCNVSKMKKEKNNNGISLKQFDQILWKYLYIHSVMIFLIGLHKGQTLFGLRARSWSSANRKNFRRWPLLKL